MEFFQVAVHWRVGHLMPMGPGKIVWKSLRLSVPEEISEATQRAVKASDRSNQAVVIRCLRIALPGVLANGESERLKIDRGIRPFVVNRFMSLELSLLAGSQGKLRRRGNKIRYPAAPKFREVAQALADAAESIRRLSNKYPYPQKPEENGFMVTTFETCTSHHFPSSGNLRPSDHEPW